MKRLGLVKMGTGAAAIIWAGAPAAGAAAGAGAGAGA